MPNIQANGINMYYKEYGSGPPLICISGLGATHEAWILMQKGLAEHFRVIVFDNRGIGKTDAPETAYSIEQMADDTMALMDELKISSAHIAGHSMGTSIAQNIAFRQPKMVKTLILCNFFIKLAKKSAFMFKTNAFLLRNGVSEQKLFRVVLPWLFSDHFFEDKKNVENLLKMNEFAESQQSVGAFERQIDAACAFDGKNLLPDLKMPILIISGAADILTPPSEAENMAKMLENCDYCTIPTGHLSLSEAPQTVLEHILTFSRKNSDHL